jgi:LCP family protein required for cell wall assembly
LSTQKTGVNKKPAVKTKKTVRILVLFLVVLIALAGVVVYAIYNQYQSISKNPLAAFDNSEKEAEAAMPDSIEGAKEQNKNDITYNGVKYTPNKNVINILLLGIDWDETRTDMGWRSDMNMLCTVDFEKNTMTMTSIPRDTRANVYHVDENGKITKSGLDKINAAYSYGRGPDQYGPQNAMRCISEFLSIDGQYYVPIDYYISIDLAGVPKFASALGGIKLTLDVDFPGIGNKGDEVLLDEENSRAYLENRKQVGGELNRVSHEQQYLIAVAKKIKDKGAVESAPSLYTSFLKFMHTNLSLDQIVAFAKVLDNMNMDNMTLQTIGGDFDYIDSLSFFIPDMNDVESKIVQAMYTPVS